ncbi:MAG: glycoside hydrolase family 9 protein [Fibrobacteraceae bacterium]|nr:glycoside hydrolase family 9 protein [Fibrobacteraceae bacterium]
MKNSILASLFAIPVFAATPAINQMGFAPKAEKIIIIPGNDGYPVEVRNLSGKKVLDLKPSLVWEWEYSNEEVQIYDISKITTPGTYRLFRNGAYLGNPIEIKEDAYREVTQAAFKWFYFQRASMALEPKYAGKWARAAGQMDNKVIIYGTDALTSGKKNAKAKYMNSSKGWYDAGDYGKYIVNSGITVYTILQLYEHFPEFVDKLSLNIPNTSKNLPDLLEEVKYNLDWMLTMQDKDGGVYHKVTTLKFGGSVLPESDVADRYAIIKNVTASLDFAGALAQASVVYSKFDKAYADKMLKAAEKAWAWAKKNPKAIYKQPDDVQTGSYVHDGEDAMDEFRFAAGELYNATKKEEYLNELKTNPMNGNGPWWGDMNMLGIYRVATGATIFGDSLSKAAEKILIDEANSLKAEGDTSGYRLPMHKWNWNWGSNSAVANNGIILLHAYYITGNVAYLNGAQKCLDYLLGKNPFEMSYVTGFGYRSPRNPHHRPSEGDLVDDPVPGMLVGGPHLGKQDINLDGTENWKCPNYASSDMPALAYLDDRCSYATNEVAINWNAPLGYLAGALQAIYEGNNFMKGKGLK